MISLLEENKLLLKIKKLLKPVQQLIDKSNATQREDTSNYVDIDSDWSFHDILLKEIYEKPIEIVMNTKYLIEDACYTLISILKPSPTGVSTISIYVLKFDMTPSATVTADNIVICTTDDGVASSITTDGLDAYSEFVAEHEEEMCDKIMDYVNKIFN